MTEYAAYTDSGRITLIRKLFESKQIRSVWNEMDQKWYFSIADVAQALTDTVNVKEMRKRDSELNSNWGTFCPPLELIAPDGKRRKTQCANAENLLRIIQSIPSPKAEPFKLWLAWVGYDRLNTMNIVNIEDKTFMAILLSAVEAFPSKYPAGGGPTAPPRKERLTACCSGSDSSGMQQPPSIT